jgi:nicotinamide-nucleotide amidase
MIHRQFIRLSVSKRRASGLLLLLSAFAGLCAETNRPLAAAPKPLEYMIVVTGEELLRGVYPDAHTAFITRTLHLLGGHCLGSMTVDDRSEDIQEALRFASRKAPLIIVTGGLGPTLNDVTRGALGDFSGIRLEENAGALAELERRFKQPRDQLRANLRRQALVPVRGSFLKNPNGTAVGLVFEMDATVIVALPGPPRELQPMVNDELVPYLRRKFGVHPPGSMLTLRFVGIGQSQIDQTLRQRVSMPPEVVESSLFEGSRVDFMFALPGAGPEDLAKLKQIEASIRQHLGEYIYANDGSSLEEVVVGLLKARGDSLVLVEAGSGGHIAGSLDGVKGISDFLKAAWVAPTDEQVRQMLAIPAEKWSGWTRGEERLKGLGNAAREKARSRWALVVSEVDWEAAGRGSVWMGLGWPGERWDAQRLPVQGTGETAHASLTTQILERVRRQLVQVK